MSTHHQDSDDDGGMDNEVLADENVDGDKCEIKSPSKDERVGHHIDEDNVPSDAGPSDYIWRRLVNVGFSAGKSNED